MTRMLYATDVMMPNRASYVASQKTREKSFKFTAIFRPLLKANGKIVVGHLIPGTASSEVVWEKIALLLWRNWPFWEVYRSARAPLDLD